MKARQMLAILDWVLVLVVCQGTMSGAAPMGTAFTYQGRLMDANTPADGLYDLQFKLFDDPNVILGKNLLESQEIAILAKNPQPAVGAIEHMIDVSTKSYTFSSRHNENILNNYSHKSTQKMYRTPLIPPLLIAVLQKSVA